MRQSLTVTAAPSHQIRQIYRRWFGLSIVLLATFMDLIDVTIVNVALPRIQRELSGSYATGQWAVAGYSLAFAIVLVTGGRLGDIHGRRRIFMIGVTGFTVASIAAGAAVSPGMLIAARIVQGAFGGVMVPQVMSVIATQFPPGRDRTAALSLYGVLMGAAQVSGPVLGGLLTSAGGLGWRAIFLFNVPVGVLALVGAKRWVDESRSEHPLKLDLPGMVMIGLASLLFTYPLVQGREFGWPVWTIVLLLASVPMLACFVWYERYRAAPLVPMRLFASRSFAAGLLLMLVLFAGISSYFLALTWALQFGFGWTPLHLALTILAWPAGVALTAQLTHRHGRRRGRLLVGVGTTIMSLGMAGLALTFATGGAHLTSGDLVPWMVGSGLGMGLTIPVLSDLVLGDVPAADAGAASGVLNSVIQIGGTVGVALAGVIFFSGPAGAGRTLAFSAAVFLLAALLSPLLPHRSAQ